jgi:hypothetical protein
MDFYDTMTPEELQQYMQMQGRIRNEERNKDSPLRQPLAPGLPRVYDLRGDPSSWQLPSPPPSPPPEPATPPPPPQPPPEPATPPTGPPRCPVCGTLRLPGEATCLDGGVCTRAFDDTVSDTDVNEEGPVSPVHPQQPLGEPGPSEA